MTKKERFIPIEHCGLCVREAAEGEQSRVVDGNPIVFGVRSTNLTPWSDKRAVFEVLEPGCITEELLRNSDVVLNINHSTKVTDIFGRHRGTEKDTLILKLNPKNVASSCDMPKTNNANDTLELIKRGDISGMSFAFEDDWEDTENGVSYERLEEKTADGKEIWIRHVKRIKALYDVSIVTYPAYEQTSVASREESDLIGKAIDAQIAEAEKREKTDTGKGDDDEKREKKDDKADTGKGEGDDDKKDDKPNGDDDEEEQRERMAAQQRMIQRSHLMRDNQLEDFYV